MKIIKNTYPIKDSNSDLESKSISLPYLSSFLSKQISFFRDGKIHKNMLTIEEEKEIKEEMDSIVLYLESLGNYKKYLFFSEPTMVFDVIKINGRYIYPLLFTAKSNKRLCLYSTDYIKYDNSEELVELLWSREKDILAEIIIGTSWDILIKSSQSIQKLYMLKTLIDKISFPAII